MSKQLDITNPVILLRHLNTALSVLEALSAKPETPIIIYVDERGDITSNINPGAIPMAIRVVNPEERAYWTRHFAAEAMRQIKLKISSPIPTEPLRATRASDSFMGESAATPPN